MTYCVLLASSRQDSNTRRLVARAFPLGVESLEDIAALKVGFYSYTFENESDDFFPLINRMLVQSTWFIATPVYWYTMSAQTKVFLDRLTDLLEIHKAEGRLLRGKSLAVLACGTEPALPPSFDEPFRLTCGYLGMRFRGSHYTQFSSTNVPMALTGCDAQAFVRSVVAHEDA
jgi:NAD(P)H-dependent FMN reductase